MIMFDDDDDVVVVVDDDDVERTRTGPYAVRSDVEHLVNHNAKIYIYISFFKQRFQLVRRRRANMRGQIEVFGRIYNINIYIYIHFFIFMTIILTITHFF